jgi:hypothetical protein
MIFINLPYCLAFNALAYRAHTARQGKGDVAMPVLRPCPSAPSVARRCLSRFPGSRMGWYLDIILWR